MTPRMPDETNLYLNDVITTSFGTRPRIAFLVDAVRHAVTFGCDSGCCDPHIGCIGRQRYY